MAHACSSLDRQTQNSADQNYPRLGRYLIVRQLGAGGMGVVYEGYDPGLDRKVALKVMHRRARHSAGPTTSEPSAQHQTLRRRMVEEAQALAGVPHPNVVAIYDVGESQGQVYLAMELLEGADFRGWLTKTSPSWRSILAHAIAATRGLAAAHVRGIVHRDIKPDNLFIDNDGELRVVDFGLAGGTSPSVVPTLATASANDAPRSWGSGTPGYIAPELCGSLHGSISGDVFGLCATIYEAIYGIRPFAFERESANAYVAAVVARRFEAPRKDLRPPRTLRKLLELGLSANPGERPSSMFELRRSLEALTTQRVSPPLLAVVMTSAITAASFGAFKLHETSRATTCGRTSETLRADWNHATHRQLHDQFAKSLKGSETMIWPVVQRNLGNFVENWTDTKFESCTGYSKSLNDGVFDQQSQCLDRAARQFLHYIQVLRAGDTKVIRNAAIASASLANPRKCEDQHQAFTHQEQDPRTATQREHARTLLDHLAEIQVEIGSGADASLRVQVGELRRQAENHELSHILAELLLQEGFLLERAGLIEQSNSNYRAAILHAERSDNNTLIIDANARLLFNEGYRRAQADSIDELFAHAKAHVERNGSDPLQLVALYGAVPPPYGGNGMWEKALAATQQAIYIFEQHLAHDDRSALLAWLDLATTLNQMGHSERAIAIRQRVLPKLAASLGASHDAVTLTMGNLSQALSDVGRNAEAMALVEQAIEQATRVGEAKRREILYLYIQRAQLFDHIGQHDRAMIEYLNCVEIETKASGRHSPYANKLRLRSARAAIASGQLDNADLLIGKLLEQSHKPENPAHNPQTISIRLLQAELRVHQSRHAEADALLDRVQANLKGHDMPEGPRAIISIDAQRIRGLNLLMQGNATAAEAQLRTALGQLATLQHGPYKNTIELRTTLAQSLMAQARWQAAATTITAALPEDIETFSPAELPRTELWLLRAELARTFGDYAWLAKNLPFMRETCANGLMAEGSCARVRSLEEVLRSEEGFIGPV